MSTNGFGKAYPSMFAGSMVGRGPLFFAVWSYVISHTVPAIDESGQEYGKLMMNPKPLSLLIGGCTKEEVAAVIEEMCQPDPDSQCHLEEGRKLVPIDQFTYRVVSFVAYRNKLSDSPQAVKNRETVARWRANQKNEQKAQ